MRGLGSVGFEVSRGVRLTANLQLEDRLTSAGDTRVRALVGVTGRLGRLRGLGAEFHEPDAVLLEVWVPGAPEVVLLGAFNDWEPVSLTEIRPGHGSTELALSPGEHEYLYLVDGELYLRPNAALLRVDGFGGANAVIVVRAAER